MTVLVGSIAGGNTDNVELQREIEGILAQWIRAGVMSLEDVTAFVRKYVK